MTSSKLTATDFLIAHSVAVIVIALYKILMPIKLLQAFIMVDLPLG